MGFAKEIEDFLNGYKMTTALAGDAEDRKIRKDAAKRAADKDEQAEMDDLSVDAETYLSPSVLAARKRAPKAASTATPAAGIDIIAPYGDNPGEEEDGYAMASGGLVPDPEEDKKQGIPTRVPEDNAAAAKARKAGKTGYYAGNGETKPLTAMNGKARNTYGDDPERGPKGPDLEPVFKSANTAIKVAMDGFAASGKQKRPAIGGAEPEIDFNTGKGAATPEEIKAIDAKIDPDGTMDPWAKGRARLGYAYNYFISRGEPEKAANVSQRILLFDKMASQARGKIAVQLISSGDADKGASVLVDAYNDNIHDGSQLDVKPTGDGRFSYSITKDGKVVNEGVGTAADLAGLAGNVANGSEFTRRTARLAAGDDPGTPATPAPGTAAATPPQGIPTTPDAAAAPAAQPAADGAAPADAPAEGKAAAKGPRNLAWAKKQYSYAASVMKSWEDEVSKNPTPENKARLKDAQIRLAEAEQDAIAIRMSTATKNADKGNIAIQFDKTLGEWREAADPLEALPAAPKDGLRGAEPAPAAPAAPAAGIPAGGAPAAPATPAGDGGAKYLGYKNGGTAWDIGGQMVTGPQPGALKPVTPELAAQAKAALTAGKPRAAVLRMLLENGYNPTGL